MIGEPLLGAIENLLLADAQKRLDLALSPGDSGGRVGNEVPSERRSDVALTATDGLYGFHEFSPGHALHNVAMHAGVQSARNVFLILGRGKEYHFDIAIGVNDRLHGL